MSSTWRRLAEMVGIGETNWDNVNRKKNMQRWGTEFASRQDRHGQGGGDPMRMFRQQKQAAQAAMPPRMTPKPGGLQIPSGTDRPGQGNPLAEPPRPVAKRAPQQPADHTVGDDDWLEMLYGDDED